MYNHGRRVGDLSTGVSESNHEMAFFYGLKCTYTSCADLEGEGIRTPLEFAKLNIADITGNQKNSYFFIFEHWTPPPSKIFLIRAWTYLFILCFWGKGLADGLGLNLHTLDFALFSIKTTSRYL